MLLEVRLDRLVPQMNNIIDYMLQRTQVFDVSTRVATKILQILMTFDGIDSFQVL